MNPFFPASSFTEFAQPLTGHLDPQDRPGLRPVPAPPIIRASQPSAAARIGWPASRSTPLWSANIIVDGGSPFDRKTLEASGLLSAAPHTVLYCSELPGDTPIARGHALLSEIRQRKAAGEFSVMTPVLLFMHATMRSGELMLGDSRGKLLIPLAMVLHALSRELLEPGVARAGSDPAPVVLSACGADAAASSLRDFPRPVLINGGDHDLFTGDACAVFRSSLRIAERIWQSGKSLPAAGWFDQLASVSGDILHHTGRGEWVVHEPLTSSTSLCSIGREQTSLYVRAKLAHGSVDDLAEALQLFGTAALERADSPPPMHHLLLTQAQDLRAKIALLAAVGVPVDQRDKRGNTLLHRLCGSGRYRTAAGNDQNDRIALVRLLLANGADPGATNHAGTTPRKLAARSRLPSLRAALDPRQAELDRPSLGPAGLRIAAAEHGWHSVLSLLDDPQQIMDVDDGDDPDSDGAGDTGSAGTVIPATERDRAAAAALVMMSSGDIL